MSINIPPNTAISLPQDPATMNTSEDLKSQQAIVDVSELLTSKDLPKDNILEYNQDVKQTNPSNFSMDSVVQSLFSLDQNLKISARDLTKLASSHTNKNPTENNNIIRDKESKGFDKSLETPSSHENTVLAMEKLTNHHLDLTGAAIKFKGWLTKFSMIQSLSSAFSNTLNKFLKM